VKSVPIHAIRGWFGDFSHTKPGRHEGFEQKIRRGMKRGVSCRGAPRKNRVFWFALFIFCSEIRILCDLRETLRVLCVKQKTSQKPFPQLFRKPAKKISWQAAAVPQRAVPTLTYITFLLPPTMSPLPATTHPAPSPIWSAATCRRFRRGDLAPRPSTNSVQRPSAHSTSTPRSHFRFSVAFLISNFATAKQLRQPPPSFVIQFSTATYTLP
jgi:hypothetical protein